jgi:hypothetical protein
MNVVDFEMFITIEMIPAASPIPDYAGDYCYEKLIWPSKTRRRVY